MMPRVLRQWPGQLWGQTEGYIAAHPTGEGAGGFCFRHSPTWFFQSSAACVFRGLSMFGSGNSGWVSWWGVTWAPLSPDLGWRSPPSPPPVPPALHSSLSTRPTCQQALYGEQDGADIIQR